MVCLDLGTSAFRCLRRQNSCLVGRKSPATYISLPINDADVSLLKQMRIPVIRSEDSLVVVGAAALDLAQALRISSIPLLMDGLVPTNDPLGRQLIAMVIDSILPDDGNATPCGLISRSAVDFEQSTDLQLFAQLLRLKGYNPVPVTSASAVAYAELGDDQFSGLVLDWGASGASLGAYRLGETLAECNLVNGGNLIDERIARVRNRFCWDREGNRYLNTHAIEMWKQATQVRIDAPRTEDDKLIAAIYQEQLVNLLMRFKAAIIATPAAWLFAQNVKLVCCGGCTQIGGFVQMIASLIRELELPIKLSEILVCAPDQFRMTRGGMIQMELDRMSERSLISA